MNMIKIQMHRGLFELLSMLLGVWVMFVGAVIWVILSFYFGAPIFGAIILIPIIGYIVNKIISMLIGLT